MHARNHIYYNALYLIDYTVQCSPLHPRYGESWGIHGWGAS